MISSHFFARELGFRLRSSVTRHATRPNVWSRYPYNASRIAFGSLRVSTFSNPILTRASISVTRNSTQRDRIPFRRRSRCRRMRSAADERAIVSAGTVMTSLRFARQCNYVRREPLPPAVVVIHFGGGGVPRPVLGVARPQTGRTIRSSRPATRVTVHRASTPPA